MDSSTSKGWSKKTNFPEDIEHPIQATVKMEVARSHAMRMLENGIKDHSQWFMGKLNDVLDALSGDFDQSDKGRPPLLLIWPFMSFGSFQTGIVAKYNYLFAGVVDAKVSDGNIIE